MHGHIAQLPADRCPLSSRLSSIHDPGAPDRPLRGSGSGGTLSSGTERKRILLVEDDHSIREAVQGVLEDAGYQVLEAKNGRDALERLRSGGVPDLIVLDLRMPVMDGWEFRALQKNDPNLAPI